MGQTGKDYITEEVTMKRVIMLLLLGFMIFSPVAALFAADGDPAGTKTGGATDTVGVSTTTTAPSEAAKIAGPVSHVDTGDTAWVLISTALVLLMTPGLAFFYGGMVGRKNVLGVLMQCFIILCVISIQWVLFGYSLSFGPGKGLLGRFWMGRSFRCGP